MEKNYKEIKEHLYLTGYSNEAIGKICGWLIGRGFKSADKAICYKKGSHTFEDFLNWYNGKNNNLPLIEKGDFVHIEDNVDVLCLTEQEGNFFIGTNGILLQRYELKDDSRFCSDEEVEVLEARLKKNGVRYCQDCNDIEVILDNEGVTYNENSEEWKQKCIDAVKVIVEHIDNDDSIGEYEKVVTTDALNLLIQISNMYE
jgi:hypothetical protein